MVENNEENRSALAHQVIESWDMGELIQYAHDHLVKEYKTAVFSFQSDWEELNGEGNDELEKNLSQSVRPRSTLNPDLKIRPSETLTGYHILLDPLSDCVEDEAFDTLDRARVACHGWQNHLWITENIYKPDTDPPERIGQRVRPYRREDTDMLLERMGPQQHLLDPVAFFVTEEPWKDEKESFIWWGEDEV